MVTNVNIRRISRTLLPLLVPLLSILLLVSLLPPPAESSPDQTSQATLVVNYGDGQVEVRRVTFTAPITSAAALQLAGFDLATSAGAVCAIDGTGCPGDDCFCCCPPPYSPCVFWSYYHWDGAAWQFAGEGPSDYVLVDGAIEGYSWGGESLPTMTREMVSALAAIDWLRDQQLPNGSYGNSASSTVDTLFAATAAGADIEGWKQNGGATMLDYLELAAANWISGNVAATGKLAVGVAAAGLDPRNAWGMDLVAELEQDYDTATGALGESNNSQAWGMLGWRAAGETVPVTATRYLADLAEADGGWGWVTGWGSDVDMTSLVLEALIAAGEPLTTSTVISGLDYMATQQEAASGGFLSWGVTNTNSTAWGLQGLIAGGEDPLGVDWTTGEGLNPVDYLVGMQLEDGSFPWADKGDGSNLLSTQQVIPALVGRPFPFSSRDVSLRKAENWIASQQQPDGSFPGLTDTGGTLDAVLALASTGYDLATRSASGVGGSALEFLATQVPTYPNTSAASAGKLIVGVVAAGGSPLDFGGLDLAARLDSYYVPATGAYGSTTWDQAWSILALASMGAEIPTRTVAYMEDIQATDGGWGYFPEGDSWGTDTDSTAMALQALAAAGVGADSAVVQAGLDFLRDLQEDDGGFAYSLAWGGTSATSTGLALQALAAFGEQPRWLNWSLIDDDGLPSPLVLRNPLDALLALQSTQGGFEGYGGPNDPASTYQAVPGIAAQSFPPVRKSFGRIFLPLVLLSSG